MTNDHVVCDLLMKDGIDGRQDEDAIARACLLTQLAVELGRKRTVLHAPSPCHDERLRLSDKNDAARFILKFN